MAAFKGESVTLKHMTFDFTKDTQGYARADTAKKASAYMTIWMYIIRQFEHAKDLCTTDTDDYNYEAALEFDKGVAYYTGSIEGSVLGGADGNSTTGTAAVNLELFNLFFLAQNALYTRQC